MTGPTLRTSFSRTLNSAQAVQRGQSTADRYCQRQFFKPRIASRAFSSCPHRRQEQQQFKAAPEISTDELDNHSVPLLQRVRIVPASPSYFSGRPYFTDDYLEVQRLYLKFKGSPIIRDPPRIKWRPFIEFKASMGNEPVKELKYKMLLRMLDRLHRLDPAVRDAEVNAVIESHMAAQQPVDHAPKKHEVDNWGRALGVGKRKTATAMAYLVEGEGEVLVNGRSLTQMFGRLHDRESAMWALKATNRLDKYNVFAIVRGGGVTGQTEALTLAVAKALLIHEPALKPAIRRGEIKPYSDITSANVIAIAGCITRDPRKVERKKAGHLKARKKPAWVKR